VITGQPTSQPIEKIRPSKPGEHQARNTEEGRRRHVVAGNRQAVLETGDAAAGGVEVGRGLGLGRRPLGDPQGDADENAEHHDGGPVGGLLLCVAEVGTGGQGPPAASSPSCGQSSYVVVADHLEASLMIVRWSPLKQ
jgi:hypothetical protein